MTREPATPALPYPADVATARVRRSSAGAEVECPNARFVFSFARSRPDTTGEPAAGQITEWQRVLQLASDENALISLRRGLRHAYGTPVPADVERQLAILSLDREYRMHRLRERLEQLLVVLNRANIDAVLLKGGALAATIFDSFTARAMRDIDILVRPGQADEARRLMLRHEWAVDPALPGDRSYSTHHHLPPLRDGGDSGLRLEIHRSLLPAGHPFRLTDDEIWGAAQSVRIGAGHALVMHPSHHAVHIAIHFAWSHMLKLGAWNAFRDLDTLSASQALDWSEFTTTAERWGASSCCYWTARLARVLSGFVIPDAVTHELRPRLPEFVQLPLTRHFVRSITRAESTCPSARLDQLLWTLAMQPNREGHGDVRPWRVSLDLVFDLNERARDTESTLSEPPLRQLWRSGRYLSEILA